MPAPDTGTPTVASAWRVDIDLDPNGSGNYAQLRGIKNLELSVDSTVKDASDYDSGLWSRKDAITALGWGIKADVNRNLYGGVEDPAQAYIRTAHTALTLVHARWYQRRAGGEAYEGWALVQFAPKGGNPDDLSEATITLMGQGQRLDIANPYAALALPVVNSLSVTTGPAAGDTQLVVTGSNLSGATGVKFGTTAATGVLVVSPSQIVCTSPAGAAGVKDVTVTTAAGTSAVSVGGKFTYV